MNNINRYKELYSLANRQVELLTADVDNININTKDYLINIITTLLMDDESKNTKDELVCEIIKANAESFEGNGNFNDKLLQLSLDYIANNPITEVDEENYYQLVSRLKDERISDLEAGNFEPSRMLTYYKDLSKLQGECIEDLERVTVGETIVEVQSEPTIVEVESPLLKARIEELEILLSTKESELVEKDAIIHSRDLTIQQKDDEITELKGSESIKVFELSEPITQDSMDSINNLLKTPDFDETEKIHLEEAVVNNGVPEIEEE